MSIAELADQLQSGQADLEALAARQQAAEKELSLRREKERLDHWIDRYDKSETRRRNLSGGWQVIAVVAVAVALWRISGASMKRWSLVPSPPARRRSSAPLAMKPIIQFVILWPICGRPRRRRQPNCWFPSKAIYMKNYMN